MKCSTTTCFQNILPKTAKYFKEELVSEILQIPTHKPDIERVLDVTVWPEIVDYKLVDTPIGVSNEGQHLSGVKLVVELKLRENLSYVADVTTQTVQVCNYETLKSMFIILPDEVDGVAICDLIRSGKLTLNPYIEAVDFKALDCRTVFRCAMIFLDARIC